MKTQSENGSAKREEKDDGLHRRRAGERRIDENVDVREQTEMRGRRGGSKTPDASETRSDPPAEPPRGLVRHLLPFQREGLAWMMGNEKTAVKGGILADEMGMGKTIQAVSLVLKSKEERLDRIDAGVMDAAMK